MLRQLSGVIVSTLAKDAPAMGRAAAALRCQSSAAASSSGAAGQQQAPKVVVYKPSFPFVPSAPKGPRTAPPLASAYTHPWERPESPTKTKIYDFMHRATGTFLQLVTLYCIFELTRGCYAIVRVKYFGGHLPENQEQQVRRVEPRLRGTLCGGVGFGLADGRLPQWPQWMTVGLRAHARTRAPLTRSSPPRLAGSTGAAVTREVQQELNPPTKTNESLQDVLRIF